MITDLYRYPIKGLTGEPIKSVRLLANEGIAGDRAIAIARKQDVFDPANPVGLPKTHFLMLMRDEALALLDCKLDDETNELVVRKNGDLLIKGSIDSEDDRRQIEAFFREYLNDEALKPDLTFSQGHKFTDISRISPEKMKAVSLINLNSVKALEEATGNSVDIRRFRANIYFDGVPAWEELNWIDRSIAIGSARADVVMRTTRCAATQVNPDTAERDINVPKEIRRHFGHSDMGIYAEIQETGVVTVGDHMVAVID